MFNYLLLLNRHKTLSLKRKSDYWGNWITALVLIFSLILLMSIVLSEFSKEDFAKIAGSILPAIVILDFSLRFFAKKTASVAIFPYLTLPIPRKTLILYMILADLQRFWLWGCTLIYGGILGYGGILTFWNVIFLLFCILLNNYFVVFIKILTGGYAILTYPLCLGFVAINLLIISFLSPVFVVIIEITIMCALFAAVFYTLKENLHKELNRFAL